MNNMKKLLALVLAVFMLISMAACNPSAGTTGNGTTSKPSGSKPPVEPGKNATYTVTIQTAGKMAVEGINVQIFKGTEMIDVKQTNAEGKASFTLPESNEYTIKLNKVKPGYKYNESYTFVGTSALIVLTTELITGESMNGAEFNLGDVMYDFEITDTDGNTHKLSEILKEKKAVVLNFFFTTCSPCVSEVPYMEEAYNMFKDDIEILSVNSNGASEETEAACAAFKAQYGLSFPVAKVPNGWATMASGGYPTTYVIDRYGVVCLVEVGALPSLRPWVGLMQYFTADDYQQKLCESLDDIVSKVLPTEEDETPEDLAATLGNADGNIVYSNETEDEYCWPFIITEKDGVSCIKASNTGNEVTYSILCADVTLKKGQAIAFDYLISSELNADILHVIVNDTSILTISGMDDVPTWKSAYAWVAEKDGTYKVVLSYIKDDSDNVGDDTAYIKNFRILDNLDDIDTPTFLPMNAATSDDGFSFEYVDIFYNEEDRYYHVGSVDGPLLLANLTGVTQLYEDTSVYLMAYDGKFVKDGVDYLDQLTPYANYAANGLLSSYCTVDQGLADLLKLFVSIHGFDGNDDEWLKLCRYYAAYGTDGAQLQDPIQGLATFSAFEAKLGDDNVLSYDGRPIMPRGMLAAFRPTESGVYRITTRMEVNWNLSGFIFPDTHYHHSQIPENGFYTHEADERMYDGGDAGNLSMVYYMEAGKTYYIDIALGDIYGVGDVPFTIEFLGAEYDIFRLCSQPYYTAADIGGTIDPGNLVAGGIDVVLGQDGYYYHDLGKDADGNQIYGSKIYADFTGIGLINTPIMDYTYIDSKTGEEKTVKGLVTLGAFDFSKDENDQYLDSLCQRLGKDRAAVEEYLKEAWGEMYEEKIVEYRLDDYFNGIYHGNGNDETEAIKAYFDKVITEEGAMQGTVAVDEELARLLHLIVSKYTFENVDYSWKKLCYYWDYMGSN